ncbi:MULTISPECIES: hypothetical protein [unclassified Streptomyces]|uniref:hypothetical protein n=1 Tax=unclassified Streptomyces TaxID=2593676 RepID=UPI003819F59E
MPLKGGEQWETDAFRPPSEPDRLLALVRRLELNVGKREIAPLPSVEPRRERADN